jgi:hypothetical protein
MEFHLGSFALGFASGYASAKLGSRLRGLGLQLATIAVRIVDSVSVRVARGREDLEDLWAEARARARTPAAAPSSDQPS